MQISKLITWEDRLTRISFILLCLATTSGVFTGAVITMYYELIPNISELADKLGSAQFSLYLLAILCGLFHLPLALTDLQQKLWSQAGLRLALSLGPLFIFLATDGLVAHALWWEPISDTNRFHVLHHTLFAGVPLTAVFGIGIYWGWKPSALHPTPPIKRGALIASIVIFLTLALIVGVLSGVWLTALGAAIVIVAFLLIIARLAAR